MCIVFFSSRRRHTRFDCDWSSDVCSSDLLFAGSAALPDGYKDCTKQKKTLWKPASEAEAKAKRSEEHTSELQSQSNLVCRLLLEKKKKKSQATVTTYTYTTATL